MLTITWAVKTRKIKIVTIFPVFWSIFVLSHKDNDYVLKNKEKIILYLLSERKLAISSRFITTQKSFNQSKEKKKVRRLGGQAMLSSFLSRIIMNEFWLVSISNALVGWEKVEYNVYFKDFFINLVELSPDWD